MGKTKVLYNVCLGRSGSTLLSFLLPEYYDVFNVGEILNLGLVFTDKEKTHRCGCTELMKDCEFWKEVRKDLDVEDDQKLDDYMSINNPNYVQFNGELFTTVHNKVQSEFLLDKSMNSNRLKKLLDSQLLDIYIIHLVRDGRAVAHSWRKYAQRKKRGLAYLRLLSAAVKWSWLNVKLHLKYSGKKNYIRLRYEDIAQNPSEEIEKIQCHFSLQEKKEDRYRVTHFVGGNRMRRSYTGLKDIKLDTSYQGDINSLDWLLVSLIQLIPLTLFGYNLRKG